jgi:peptide deformylase
MIITDEEALRVECVNVLPEEIGPLRDQLERELKHSETLGRPGIGLAAPQIGIAKNMAIVRISDQLSVDLVNCNIVTGYDKAIFEQEGCLSFPGRFEKTMRYQEILIENNAAEPHRLICTGLLAVVCQHELDHLVGKLLPDVALASKKINNKKIRPNDKCPCQSGRKYKKCCGR